MTLHFPFKRFICTNFFIALQIRIIPNIFLGKIYLDFITPLLCIYFIFHSKNKKKFFIESLFYIFLLETFLSIPMGFYFFYYIFILFFIKLTNKIIFFKNYLMLSCFYILIILLKHIFITSINYINNYSFQSVFFNYFLFFTESIGGVVIIVIYYFNKKNRLTL